MISCFVNGMVYCAIRVGNNIELYHVKEIDERILIATFPINEDLIYFDIGKKGVFINNYICNLIAGSFKPYKGALPVSPNKTTKVKVTFRSKLAVLADYKFIGAPFEEIKLKTIPLNVNYKVNGFTVTEAFWGTKFIGNSDEFISETFGGTPIRIDLMDCLRNHVYREYDHIISSCETCNKTKYGGLLQFISAASSPTTKVVFKCFIESQTVEMLFGRDKNDAVLLVYNDDKLISVYQADETYLYKDMWLSKSGLLNTKIFYDTLTAK